jgi:hypothetical protein
VIKQAIIVAVAAVAAQIAASFLCSPSRSLVLSLARTLRLAPRKRESKHSSKRYVGSSKKKKTTKDFPFLCIARIMPTATGGDADSQPTF